MRIKPNLRRNEKGQSLVEFAVVVPVLILLVMGIIEFGWLFNGQITLTSAAREGARTAIVDGGIEQAIANHVEGLSGFTFSGFEQTDDKHHTEEAAQQLISVNDGEVGAVVYRMFEGDSQVQRIKVFVCGRLEPFSGLFGTSSRQLRAEAIMRKE